MFYFENIVISDEKNSYVQQVTNPYATTELFTLNKKEKLVKILQNVFIKEKFSFLRNRAVNKFNEKAIMKEMQMLDVAREDVQQDIHDADDKLKLMQNVEDDCFWTSNHLKHIREDLTDMKEQQQIGVANVHAILSEVVSGIKVGRSSKSRRFLKFFSCGMSKHKMQSLKLNEAIDGCNDVLKFIDDLEIWS